MTSRPGAVALAGVVTVLVVTSTGVGVACSTTPDVREAVAPCARARLAREWPPAAAAGPLFEGCYDVVSGPDQLQAAGLVVFTDLAEDVLEDEPPRFRLATTQPFVPATTTSWELLSTTRVRLLWLNGTSGVEMCLERNGGPASDDLGFDGDVVVVDNQPPFAHAVGRVRLKRTTCPT